MNGALAWLCLIASGLIDVAWAYSLKRANGFEDWRWNILSVALLACFVFLLGRALAALPLGVAEVVWTGIGAVGSVLVGMWLFGEALGMARLVCLALIVAGIAGLRLQSA